jgi:hypothetical protein
MQRVLFYTPTCLVLQRDFDAASTLSLSKGAIWDFEASQTSAGTPYVDRKGRAGFHTCRLGLMNVSNAAERPRWPLEDIGTATIFPAINLLHCTIGVV